MWKGEKEKENEASRSENASFEPTDKLFFSYSGSLLAHVVVQHLNRDLHHEVACISPTSGQSLPLLSEALTLRETPCKHPC